MLTIDDDLRAAAAGERREAAIEPWAIADAATRWTEDVQRPFTRGNQAAVRAGGARGDMVNRRLGQNVDREYSALRAPSRFDIETAAAALQLLGLPRGREPWGAPLIGAWVAHSGLAFALEVFVKSLWNRACVIDRSTKARELKVVPQRTLDDMFAARSDRALHAASPGATDEARAQARLKAEQRRQNGSLLERSAIASCVLDPTGSPRSRHAWPRATPPRCVRCGRSRIRPRSPDSAGRCSIYGTRAAAPTTAAPRGRSPSWRRPAMTRPCTGSPG